MLTLILIISNLMLFSLLCYELQKNHKTQCEIIIKELEEFYADYPLHNIERERVYLLVEGAKDFLEALGDTRRHQHHNIASFKKIISRNLNKLSKFGFQTDYWEN